MIVYRIEDSVVFTKLSLPYESIKSEELEQLSVLQSDTPGRRWIENKEGDCATEARWPVWPRNSIQIRVSKIPHPSERNCKLVNVIIRPSEKERAKFLLKNR